MAGDDRGGTGRRARLDAAKRVAHTDQEPAGGRVVDRVRRRPRPQRHQAGRAQEPAQGTRADIDHAGGYHHQHRTVPPAAAHRAAHDGSAPAPEPHRRPSAAVQVVRHAHLHQRVLVRHPRVAARVQDQEDQHIQKLRDTPHHRHEAADAHAHRYVEPPPPTQPRFGRFRDF